MVLAGPFRPSRAGNLAVYFLHGPSQPGPVPLTLGEALKQARVVVHETGFVERLEIENTGDEAVFVQAGDIVKGGRQDRVLTVSLLIPPRSGRVAIGSYCVEQGRWSRRGAESASRFTSAEARMPSLAAKRSLYARKATRSRDAQRTVPAPRSLGGTRADRSRPDVQQRIGTLNRMPGTGARKEARSRQAEIWADVAEVQRKLGANLATSVRSHVSGSSLQLSLENRKLTEAREKLAGQLLGHGTARDDIVGYAFAINGRINSVEVYPSNGLFRKMWPKLLQATATEAIAEQDAPAATSAVPESDKVKAFIAETARADAARDRLNADLVSERRETERTIANETRRADGTMVHLSILARCPWNPADTNDPSDGGAARRRSLVSASSSNGLGWPAAIQESTRSVMRTINPEAIANPASNYAHGVIHTYAGGERLIISGQVGIRPDLTMEDGLEAQTERAFQNVFAVVEAAGFEKTHLARLIVYVTEPGRVAVYRETRDRLLEGHCCANTYIEVPGLAAPGWLVEIEAEAVKD